MAHPGAELAAAAVAVPPSPSASDPHGRYEQAAAREATDELMVTHGDAIYTLCLRVLRDPPQAKDVLQQVFLQAHRDLPRFQGRATLRTWLFSIAIHRCQDAIKANRRLFSRIEVNEQAVVEFEDPAKSPQAQLEQQRLFADLEQCVGALSSDARMAVLLRYQLEMSFEEMATQLETKSDTLQMRVRRAMPLLKRCLERKGWTVD